MAITYGFFDARQSTAGVYDRVYTAEQMSKYFKGIFTDGILMNLGSALAVSASSGMVVQVGTGRAFADARWMENDTVLDLTIPDAHAILHRKDIIVVQLDYDNRLIDIVVKSGTAASIPVAPEVVRSSAYYELELAEISVPAGTTAITDALITDKRADQSVCGYVTGIIEQIDTATFWTQLQAAFMDWFDEMKDQLDEDAAGHLELQIQTILGDFATNELTTTASQAYAVGSYLVYDGVLYRVTTAITSGGTIVTSGESANVTPVTVGDEIKNKSLWYSAQAISTATNGTIATINDPRITADHVLTKWVPANSSYITSDITCTTSAGQAIITGTCTAATTAEIVLTKKDN